MAGWGDSGGDLGSASTIRRLNLARVGVILVSAVHGLFDVTGVGWMSAFISDAVAVVGERRMSAFVDIVKRLGTVWIRVSVARLGCVRIPSGLLVGLVDILLVARPGCPRLPSDLLVGLVDVSLSSSVHGLAAVVLFVFEVWLCCGSTVVVVVFVAIGGLRWSVIVGRRWKRMSGTAVRWTGGVCGMDTLRQASVVGFVWVSSSVVV